MNDRIITETNRFFMENGFTPVNLRGGTAFGCERGYYRLTLGEGPRYFLEAAHSLEEANGNQFEDIESYMLSSGQQAIIQWIKEDIRQFILDKMPARPESVSEGVRMGKEAVAFNLLHENLDVSLIERVTGLPKSRLDELAAVV
jgi:hypothetical protein